jgi:hypothetical protein
MYMVATLHLIVQLYRFLRAFILVVEPQGYLVYFWDSRRWDKVAVNVLMCLMTWLGDALVIYRCYFIWNSNIWVVMLPTLLLLCAIGVNAYTLYWSTHPSNVNPKVVFPFLGAIYPIAFVQNVMTTGLITLKIWKQHRVSSAARVIDRSSRLTLIRLLCIVVESAMIYTLQLFVLIVVYFCQDNFQIILQSAVIPSIGIVFVLIAVRVHVTKSKGPATCGGMETIPAWPEEGDSDSGLELDRDASPPGVAATFKAAGEKLDGDDPFP